MNITLSQLRAVTFGAERVTEDADGFRFFRFTGREQEYYRQVSPNDFYRKTFASAGVRLEFRTDSETISVEAAFSRASSRSFAFIDVCSDGITVAHIGSSEECDGLFGKKIALGKGEKNVRICFPWSAETVLRSLSLDDDASLLPAVKKRRMLIFGDSITQGYDAAYPSHSYASLLADYLQADARNKGIGGERFCPRLLEKAEDGFSPDIVTVAYGTNDWSNASARPGETESGASGFFRRLSALYPQAKIFALSPIWRKDEDAEKPSGPFSGIEPMFRRVTEDLGNVTVISGYDLVPHDPAYYSDLRLHPSDAGFAFYAERLYAKIKEHLAAGPA